MNDSFQFTRPDFGKSPIVFFNEVSAELKKVRWPNRQEVIKLTGVVIGVSLAVGLYLGGLDYVFSKLMAMLLQR